MSVTPKRNLPPQSEVWGRSVDQRLDTIQAQSSRQNQDIGNTLTGVNASLVRLSEQVGEIRTITETLVEQQATLQAQQEQLQSQQQTLADQQTTLTQTVGELQTVVNGMIRIGGNQISPSSGFDIQNSAFPIASTSFVVPTGYTRAYVSAVTTVAAANQHAASYYLYNRIRINGVSMGTSFDQAKTASWVQVTSHAFWSLSGLTAGSSVPVVLEAWGDGPGPWVNSSNYGRLTYEVTFLR